MERVDAVDLADLDRRWQRALASVDARDERARFDVSRLLGASLARYLRRPLGLAAWREILPRLSSPCLRGAVVVDEGGGVVLRRGGCAEAGRCDAWREAIAGLVLGAGDGVLVARHRSRGHGDAECVDVLYTDAEHGPRFGAVPPAMRDPVAEAARSLARFGVRVRFVGLSEGTLYYVHADARGCAGDTPSVELAVEREIRRRLPGLAVRDVSPRPVLLEQSPQQLSCAGGAVR